jgi:hypothetical protein
MAKLSAITDQSRFAALNCEGSMWAPHEQRTQEIERIKVEDLTPDIDAATRLHMVAGSQVWLDTDIGSCDGICIGVGDDRAAAIDDAIVELRSRLTELEHARRLLNDIAQAPLG